MGRALNADVIRKRLSDYLTGKKSLKAFHTWFVPATWDAAESASDEMRELIYEIALLLAEYTSGHRTETSLRDKLTLLATSVVIAGARRNKWTSSSRSHAFTIFLQRHPRMVVRSLTSAARTRDLGALV